MEVETETKVLAMMAMAMGVRLGSHENIHRHPADGLERDWSMKSRD